MSVLRQRNATIDVRTGDSPTARLLGSLLQVARQTEDALAGTSTRAAARPQTELPSPVSTAQGGLNQWQSAISLRSSATPSP